MSVHPDHAAFDAAAIDVANELAFGVRPEYNHAHGCICAVGLIKAKMGQPSKVDSDSSAFISMVTGQNFSAWGPTSSALHQLYSTRAADDNRDQHAGSKRIFEYLDARKKELEEVS